MRAALSLCVLLVCVACKSGATVVEGGKGRIVFASTFAETDGIKSPVAQGRPVQVLLQREESVAGTGAGELSLSVQGGAQRTIAFLPGQALLWLDDAVDYRLNVLRYSAIVGFEPVVRVRAIDRVRAAVNAIVETDGCAMAETVKTSELVLHPNQVARVTIVPVDLNRQPLHGWLTLDLRSVPPELRVDTIAFGAGGEPNQLVLRPAAELGKTATVDVVERESKLSVQLPIATSNDAAQCPSASE